MLRQTLQTSLFPDTPRTVSKPEPSPLEKDFMESVKAYAESLGLVCIHLEGYACNNKFSPKCSCGGAAVCSICGKPVLAHCHRPINRHLAGWPDLLLVNAGMELKRHDGLEPSPLQLAVHDQLYRQGVPVMVASPGNLQEAIAFLKNIKSGKSPNERGYQ